jgi:hypothetical protein
MKLWCIFEASNQLLMLLEKLVWVFLLSVVAPMLGLYVS